jgi:acetyl-CoA C-acetyltransferase/potassium large conductance calcium-activated channel subfamily M alpha protein 1
MNEYLQGNGHEIYRTQLSYKFEGKKFKEVAAIIYNEYQGILFAIELDIQG